MISNILIFILTFPFFNCAYGTATRNTGLIGSKSPETQLREAVQQQDCQTAQALIDTTDSDVNALYPSGKTLLHEAVDTSNPSIDLIILLIKAGAQIDASYTREVYSGGPRCFGNNTGPDLSRVTTEDHTPLQIAIKQGNHGLIRELYRRGAYPPSTSPPSKKRQKLDGKPAFNQPESIARNRVMIVHNCIAPRLNQIKVLEELIRSMEISSEKEGQAYYWTIASDSAIPRTTEEAGPPKGAGAANTVSS